VDLAVQVKGIDADGERFEQAAVAKNISLAGALLLGIQRTLRPGDVLRVRHGERSAKFRIVWASPSALAGAIKVAVQRDRKRAFHLEGISRHSQNRPLHREHRS
jgi:hypothetical protein